MEEKSEKEKRVRAITRLYYSNPKVQEALASFSVNREVVPRYFEGFGKRPDTVQYPSDIMGMVNKGATSFHASEEIWNDPLQINADMGSEELSGHRKSWDLLIDIDSPFLDCSKIAAKLIIEALEKHGITNYGIKFSGSKGFHLIVSGKAFPEEYNGQLMKNSFPEWPRVISEYLMQYIKPKYNLEVGKIISFRDIAKRSNKFVKEESKMIYCSQCNKRAKKGAIATFSCPVCGLTMNRRDYQITKRRLKCVNEGCAGVLEITPGKEYYYCENCKDKENEKIALNSEQHPEYFNEMRGEDAEQYGKLDLVLVASRHLFRMPYSLHEKTSLASVVITKEQLDGFDPKDADPLRIKILPFIPENREREAEQLLIEALKWKERYTSDEEKLEKKRYAQSGQGKGFENIDFSNVNESMFPAPIKKLLKGLHDGRKRGLFVLLTFLRSLSYQPEKIVEMIQEWNKRNTPPLKEGYLKSQFDWMFRQRKKIMPPNYDNESFYADLQLIDKKPESKNPVVDVMKALKWKGNY